MIIIKFFSIYHDIVNVQKSKSTSIIIVSWVLMLGISFGALWWYKTRPGRERILLSTFPQDATILLAAAPDYTLILFVHPKCECSVASVYEFNELLSTSRKNVKAVIVFYRPDGSSESWAHTNLWETAKENKLINVIEDEGGRMAYKFGALTSGQTYLYDFSGKLVFSGGITETRGHIGNNEGRRSIAAILDKTQTLGNRSKVFGCAILSSNEIKKLTREIKNASN